MYSKKINELNSEKVMLVLLHHFSKDLTLNCVRHISQMTHSSMHLCIIDNASKDSCEKEAREIWDKPFSYVYQQNLGVAGGRNLGFKIAQQQKYKWIFCLDDDLVVEKQTLSALLEIAVSIPNVAAVGPKVYSLKRPDIFLHAYGKHYKYLCYGRSIGSNEKDFGQYDQIIYSDWFPGMAVLYNLDIVEKIGGFDETFSPYGPEEQDWFLRAQNNGFKILFAPNSHVWHPETGLNANINLFKVENVFRGHLLWLKMQTKLIVRVIGVLFIFIQFWIRPLIFIIRKKHLSKYYRSLYLGLVRSFNHIK